MASQLLMMADELDMQRVATNEEMLITEGYLKRHKEVIDKGVLHRLATKEYNNRRARRKFISEDLFGEPAWDILLDLYRARLQDKMITITSACIAADVPQTTALRWIGALEQTGLIERVQNPQDQRSSWLRLSDLAMKSLNGYFDNCLDRSIRYGRELENTVHLMFEA